MYSGTERNQVIQDLASSASYCHAYRNLWIGDIGAAAGIASGAIRGFSAVFNASGIESKGFSFAPEYERLGVKYETLLDLGTGMVLADCGVNVTARQIAEEMAETDDVVPRLRVKVTARGAVIPVHVTRTCTETATTHFFFEANSKLRALEGEARVLVHCTAGVNRSGSAIVVYAMLSHGVPYDTIATELIEAGRLRRRMDLLTNKRFRRIVRAVVEPLVKKFGVVEAAERARVAYLGEHQTILAFAAKHLQNVGCPIHGDAQEDAARALRRMITGLQQGGGYHSCVVCGAAGPEMLFSEDSADPPTRKFYCSRICQRAYFSLAS